MRKTLILSITLIVLGTAILAYRQFSYRSRETVLEVGPIKATAETTKSVPIPPILGWALIVGGAGVLIVSARRGT